MMQNQVNTISAVIFDLGRVLVNIDFDAFPRLLGIERSRTDHTDEEAIERMAIQYETGRIGTEQFLDSLENIFQHKFTRQQLLNAWNAIIEEENSAIVPIVDAVQARYQTAILSNTSPTHFQKAYENASVIRKFSKRYLSYKIGAMKPDHVVYQHVIHDLAVQPSSILFIDDVPENILAAQESGMQGIIFKDAGKLGNELYSRGIL